MTEAATVGAARRRSSSVARTSSVRGGVVLLVVVMFAAELLFGTVAIAPEAVVAILAGGGAADASETLIVRTVRLPRAITAALGGAALGCSGLVLQTLFRNRLTGPWIMGVTVGARLGVGGYLVLVALAGASVPAQLGLGGSAGVAVAAFLGALAILALMAAAARRVGPVSLLMLSVMLTFLASGATSVLLHLVPEEQGRVWEAWNDGSFGGVTWPNPEVLAPAVVLGIAGAALLVKPLDAFLLGERYAASMGVPVGRVPPRSRPPTTRGSRAGRSGTPGRSSPSSRTRSAPRRVGRRRWNAVGGRAPSGSCRGSGSAQ